MIIMQKEQIGLPTMETIAERAGVSKMTVSRVLNKHPYVSNKVRQKIQDIMKEMNYRPNLSASVLSSRSSKTLGLVIQFYNNNIFTTNYLMEVMFGLEQALDSSGFNLVLFSRIHPKSKKYEDITNWHYSGLVKGYVIVAPPVDSPIVKILLKENIPFVIVSGRSENKNANWVDADNYNGGFMATEHLINLGHRKIAYIGGPGNSANSLEREKGYIKALEYHDIKPSSSYRVTGEFEQRAAYEGALKLLSLRNPPTAIFASNDLMALGAMQAAKDKGLKIPRDISIIGFDNIDLSMSSDPALTTVNQDARALGTTAAEFLVQFDKDNPAPALKKILEVSLIKRGSTAPLKK